MNSNTSTRQPVGASDPDQLLTVSEAATCLQVHLSTIRRWIKRGNLSAYRVGGKGVRIRRGDLSRLITPLVTGEMGENMVGRELGPIPQPTVEEQNRGLRVLAELESMNRESARTRGGKPFPDSVEIIRQMREDRSHDLERATEE